MLISKKKEIFFSLNEHQYGLIMCIFRLITHRVCNLTVNHRLQANHAKTNLLSCWSCIIVPLPFKIIWQQ